MGRVSVVVAGRPEIHPVNHVFDRQTDSVMFPTKPVTKPEAALDWPWTAFEVDGVDPDGAGGWSVLVVGHAQEVTDPVAVARAARSRQVMWRTGDRVRWLQIVPSKITGRRISATS